MPKVRRIKITEEVVARLKTTDVQSDYWDADIRGFGVRVSPGGRKAFGLVKRLGGRLTRFHLGNSPDMKVAEARKTAHDYVTEIQHGRDPRGERERAQRHVAKLAADYIERHAKTKKRPKSVTDDQSVIVYYIGPRLGRKLVADVTPHDIETLHRDIASREKFRDVDGNPMGGRVRANRALALMSKMFAMAVRWRWRPDNPVRGTERFHEERRERYLSPDELGRLAKALNASKSVTAANVIRFLLLTGCRVGEALSATWDQFELEGDAPAWTKPSSHTKQKRAHRIPLSPAAVTLLQAQGETVGNPHVFAGRGNQPVTSIKKAWAGALKAASITDARVHDLRHTYASILASGGLSLPIIGQLLGHTQPATTARYSHLMDAPLREATSRVAERLEGIAEGRTATVVAITKNPHRKRGAAPASGA